MKTVFALLVTMLIALMSYSYYSLFYWTYKGEPIEFTVRNGEPFAQINSRLGREQIIHSVRFFYHYARLKNAMTQLKAGSYLIPRDSSPAQVLAILCSGKTISIAVTIPEGKNLYEIGKILEDHHVVTAEQFIGVAKDTSFLQKLNLPYDRAEGYLYPDTYFFPKHITAHDVVKIMVEEFNRKTDHLDFAHPQLSKHQIITLASIVEKETGAAHERSVIAGVFFNRMKKNIRLQSDPTTIYGIYETFNGNLKKEDLQRTTSYNTYRINGLPIGPISNPGLDAIQAVLRPSTHNFLYFVSKNDGTHTFSEDYAAHAQAVQLFQKTRSNRVGKSWRDLQEKGTASF